MSTWDADPVPERQWAVQDRIPLKQTYLFTGNGAVGKSLVDLQRAVAHVLGKPWLGMPVRQGPAIYIGAEDDADELHIRLAAILDHYEATFAAEIAGGLNLLSYVGEDCMLGIPNKSGMIEPTPLCGMLKEAALDIKPAAVMVDTVADVYGGSEIDRGQTTQFVKLMNGIAIAGNCSVAILAHPSVAGMNTGTGISGSTAWHNKVRARAYMKAMETERGDEPDPDAKSIQFLKNNYGRQGDTLLVRWQRGVYVMLKVAFLGGPDRSPVPRRDIQRRRDRSTNGQNDWSCRHDLSLICPSPCPSCFPLTYPSPYPSLPLIPPEGGTGRTGRP
jgi:RecA-family ATPase